MKKQDDILIKERNTFINRFCYLAILAAVTITINHFFIGTPFRNVVIAIVAGIYYLILLLIKNSKNFEKLHKHLDWLVVYGGIAIIVYSLTEDGLKYLTPAFMFFVPTLALFLLGSKRGLKAIIAYIAGIITIFFSYGYFTYSIYPAQLVTFYAIGIVLNASIAYIETKSHEEIEHQYILSSREIYHYKLAVSQATNHIIITDTEGKITFANEAAQLITGYSLDEMVGKTPRLWGGLQTKEFYAQMWKTIKIDRKKFTGTIQNRRKNGELYTAIAHIAPIIDETGTLIGFIGSEEDITSRINMEQQIIAQRNQIQFDKQKDDAMLSSIGEGFIATDANRKVIFINDAAKKMFGYTEDDFKDKEFVDVVKAQDEKGNVIPNYQRAMTKTYSSTDKLDLTYTYVRKDGTTFIAQVTNAPIVDNNKIIGVVEVFRDISKEKQVDRMKTEFISLASHQLRTPISTINWYLEMLLAEDVGKVNEQQKQFLIEAYNGSHRMTKLVNSLLNVTRIETGTFVVDPVPTNLVQVARSVLDELKIKIDEKKQKVTIEQDELPEIPLDQELIRIVFQNLLTNAIKYSPKNGEITVSLRKIEKGRKLIESFSAAEDSFVIQVTDNGMGIPQNQQSSIFNKLFRADNAIKSDTEGTGLGLYIIKSIVEQCKGRLWFDSTENIGTRFYVLFPITGMSKKIGSKKLAV